MSDKEDNFSYESLDRKTVKELVENKLNVWKSATNSFFWRFLKLGTLKFSVSDWDNEVWECNFQNGTFRKNDSNDEADIIILSQPLGYAFQMPFGIQTLGVSGRYKFSHNHINVPSTWKKIRIISSLYNAEIYISFKSLTSIKTLKWIWERRMGLFSQIIQQVKRFLNS